MMATALQEYSFISDADGLHISVLRCEPAGQPQGIVQLVHGMAEHKERYEDFMRFLAEHGYVSVLHDHRGHGKSVKEEADLGYMYNSGGAYLIDDIRQLNAQLHQEYPTLPVYMFGHSMGSLAVRAYLKRYDDTIDALIVCGSPSKNPAAGAGRLLARLMMGIKGAHYRSPLLQKMAFGKNCDGFIEECSENIWLCSDMDVVRAYDADPLCGYTFTLNGFENLFSLMQTVYDKKHWTLRNKHLPIRFIAGKEDPCIISPDKFQEAAGLLQTLGYTAVSARLFEGMRHEILNEPLHELVYEDILCFLTKAGKKRT